MFILYTLVQKSKIATYIDDRQAFLEFKVHLACNWLLSSDLYKLRKDFNIKYCTTNKYKRDWMFCPSVI